MAVSAGTAALQVVPQLAKTFSRDLVSQMTGPATKAATRTGKETGQRFGHQMGRQLERSGDDGARRFGLRFNKRLGAGFAASTKLASVAAGAIGGAFAAVQVVGFLKGAIDEAREAAKVGKQTAAVIKSTGGAAKISAGKVAELAESISNTVGVDDELIQSGENWLLTFKNVRDETGRGNQVFSRATQAAVDLAASMHQGEVSASGLHSANTMLGKALNDPIKGMTALAKAGVTFTKGQQEQIKALVKSGDTLKAQKIILGEVESQVRGFAAASADPFQRLSVTLANLKESIGQQLLPVLDRLATWAAKTIPVALQTLNTWWKTNKASVQKLADLLTGIFIPALGGTEGHTRTLAESMADLSHMLTTVTIFVLELIKAWLGLEHVTIGLISTFGSLEIAAGHTINAIDKLSGGTGHAGDQFVKFGEKVKNQARRELQGVREDAKRAQAAIDRLHGKDVKVTATASIHATANTRQALNALGIKGYGTKFLAAGGPVNGPGGPTADRVPAMLSAGEHVWTAKEVAKAGGHGAVEQLRERVVRGYASGGPVQDVPVPTGAAQFQRRAIEATRRLGERAVDKLAQLTGDALSKKVAEAAGGMLGGLSGPGGWKWQMAVLRRQFPGLPLISGFRPGAVTHATGRQSYHAVGRAVDVPPRMDVFNWIRGNYGKRTKELIFSPAGGRQIHNGQPHMYTGVTRADHWNHVHWAYDQGGMLPPGTSLATNNTGRPEPVGLDYARLGRAVAQALREAPPQVYLDRQKVSRSLDDAQVWERRR